MRIDLSCPFEERHAVKALGAKWDATRKVWYVIDPADLAPFARWLPAEVGGFLTKSEPAPQPKARTAKRKAWAKAANSQPLTNEGPTHYSPDFVPQDIHPDDPPW